MVNLLTIDQMRNMPIDDIISMYRNGYMIEENLNDLNPKIESVQGGITVSTGAILLIGIGVFAYIYLKK